MLSPHGRYEILKSIPLLLLFTAITSIVAENFMIVRIREDSMYPTLNDGQWALVRVGVQGILPGDIVVFKKPVDRRLTVKRYILPGYEQPLIEHGWLITPWGRWFLTGDQWDSIEEEKENPEGLFFMVGDNQFHSLDSRSYGFVSSENLVGRVVLRRAHD